MDDVLFNRPRAIATSIEVTMKVRKINNSLKSLLSASATTNNENNHNHCTNQRKRLRHRKRFTAVSSFGSLDALAEAAAHTLLEGEEHFGQTLSVVKQKSKQGKRRSELKQQQFAWQEEHRSLIEDRVSLERDIDEAVQRVAVLGLSAPLDELQMCNSAFSAEHQPQAKLQLEALRQLVQTTDDPYEAATVLSEVIEAHAFIFKAMEQEQLQQETACREARNAVYDAMRGLPENEDGNSNNSSNSNRNNNNSSNNSRHRFTQPTTRSALWENIASLPLAKDIENRGILNEAYESIGVLLDQHVNKMKGMKIQLKKLTAVDQNNNNTNCNNSKKEKNQETETPEENAENHTYHEHPTMGGWALDDHHMFVKNWKECIDRGKGHGIFRKRVALLLPHINRDTLSQHVAWFEKHRYLQRQWKEESVRWERSVKALLLQVSVDIQTLYVEEKEKEKRHTESTATQKMSSQLHTKLNEMRSVYEAKRLKEDAAQSKLDCIAEEERQKLLALETVRRQHEKNNVNEFQTMKEMELKKNEAMKVEQMKLVEELSKTNAPVREARIEHRRHVLAQREEDKKSVMAAHEREKENIKTSLEKLKTQCLYFEKIKDIKENQDPKHVLQVTRAFDAAVKELQALRLAGFGVHSRGHAPLNGFQSKTIVGDIRFKLVEQLRSAGLQATPCKSGEERAFVVGHAVVLCLGH